MDAACPDSLEISGHCLAAARVIASLLVEPGKKKNTRQKTVLKKEKEIERERERKKGAEENKLLDFLKLTVEIIQIFADENSHL